MAAAAPSRLATLARLVKRPPMTTITLAATSIPATSVIERCNPSSGIATKPAASDPATEPTVFTA